MSFTCRCFLSSRTRSSLLLTLVVIILWAHPTYAQLGDSEADSNATPIDHASHSQTFHLGGFFASGFVPNYHIHEPVAYRTVELNIFSAGVSAGKVLTTAHGAGPLRGQLEADFELIPFWVGDYPKQTQARCFADGNCRTIHWGPYVNHGISITPWLMRWNFVRSGAHRMLPWAQLGGGLLWTNHKFPLLGGSDSVINFTPQVGIGQSLFVRGDQSVDLAFKAVHVSNASLGDNNPGLNVTLQFSVGYSWWR